MERKLYWKENEGRGRERGMLLEMKWMGGKAERKRNKDAGDRENERKEERRK